MFEPMSHTVEFSTIGPADEDHGAYARGQLDRWQRAAVAGMAYGTPIKVRDTVERLNASMSRITRTLNVVG